MHPVFIQAFYYGLVIVLFIFFVSAFLRGFFVTYFKVRTSFGKYVMVKIRSPLRDYFAKGWVEEGFLIYKHKKNTIRLNIPPQANVFYKCVSVVWVDVDDEKHAIAQQDYTAVSGYDAVKNNNLHTRALMKPSITTGYEKLIILLIVVACVIGLASIYMGYLSYQESQNLLAKLPGMLNTMKASIIPSTTL